MTGKKYEKPMGRNLGDLLPNGNGTCANGSVADTPGNRCSAGGNPNTGSKQCLSGGVAKLGCISGSSNTL